MFYINELVQQAVDFSDSHPEPIVKEIQNEEERMQEEGDEISEDSEIAEELNPEEDFR